MSIVAESVGRISRMFLNTRPFRAILRSLEFMVFVILARNERDRTLATFLLAFFGFLEFSRCMIVARFVFVRNVL